MRQVNTIAKSKGLDGIAAVNGAQIAYDMAGSGPRGAPASCRDRRPPDVGRSGSRLRRTLHRDPLRCPWLRRDPQAGCTLRCVRGCHRARWIISTSRRRISSASPWGARRPSRRRSPHPSGSRPSSPSRHGPGHRCRRHCGHGWDRVNELYEAGDIAGAVEYELRMWVDGPDRGPDAVDPEMRERVREMNAAALRRATTTTARISLSTRPPPSGWRRSPLRP